ncbi:hypothetical protein ACIQMY_20825 [Streptomyces sp. NPDC091368]|uniref:hypothetical protein n=1 Tax=Streptomyces sp. NPDC091368 TaxID=3365993 RepID=UPI00380FABEF
MTETEHVPELCPNCGGLTVIRWDHVEGVSGISIDGQPLPAANLWIAEQPGPCHPSASSDRSD